MARFVHMRRATPRSARDGVRLLVTGFGPFPGVTVNASATLATRIAQEASGLMGVHAATAVVLPTCWGAAECALDAANAEFNPGVSLHFGVSGATRFLEIEEVGRRTSRRLGDAGGGYPDGSDRADGPHAVATTFPVRRIARRLQNEGYPCVVSRDAGGYLCNALYYHALQRAVEIGGARRALFVHIPSRFGVVGCDAADGDKTMVSEFAWARLMRGAMLLASSVVEAARRE